MSSDKKIADLLHHRAQSLKPHDPISLPLTTSTVFHLPGDIGEGDQYSRFGTPVWSAVEAQLSILEDAPSLIFPSGMATIAAVFYAALKSGDKILLPSDGYYTSRALAESYLAPMGISIETCATKDLAQRELSGFDLILIETPSNPGLDVCDLAHVCKKAKAAGALTVMDNTTLTSLLQRPLDLGADIVVAADTKVPGGHADLLAGHVATRDKALYDRIKEWRRFSGATCGPFDAWLLHRGLETMELRLSRMCENALALASRLKDHPAVIDIRYPGLKDDPAHSIAKKQMDGFGVLIGLTLKSEKAAEAFLANCPYIAQTTSFGSTHTSGERRARWGDDVAPGFIRLSVGCEPFEPLWQAIKNTLD